MNIDKVMQEVSAEIVGNKIPTRKVFDQKGNIVPIDQIKGSSSQALLGAIKAVLMKTGIIKNFNADNMNNLDIKPYRKNEYLLTPDVGPKKYLYNVATGKIKEV
jgi:hypothetical protein